MWILVTVTKNNIPLDSAVIVNAFVNVDTTADSYNIIVVTAGFVTTIIAGIVVENIVDGVVTDHAGSSGFVLAASDVVDDDGSDGSVGDGSTAIICMFFAGVNRGGQWYARLITMPQIDWNRWNRYIVFYIEAFVGRAVKSG